jgi:hypothetical protein
MTLTELVNEVYSFTKRPDLSAMTLAAVKSATLKAHQFDYWSKDLFESGVAFPSSANEQTWAYKTTVPLWRAAKYLRKVDSTSGLPYGKSLDLITTEIFLDAYGVVKTDVFYEAGQVLQIKTAEPVQTFAFGCYLNPNVTESSYTSWIAIEHPYAIVYDAAAIIFKAIGFSEQEASMRGLYAEQLRLLQGSNLLAVGY